jgi:mRNA degradation ribonuclease J1/J2
LLLDSNGLLSIDLVAFEETGRVRRDVNAMILPHAHRQHLVLVPQLPDARPGPIMHDAFSLVLGRTIVWDRLCRDESVDGSGFKSSGSAVP